MATFVLVHGAWHGGWCWHKLVSVLQAAGHRAFAPDLPGHGDDSTPPAEIDLALYAERICDVIDQALAGEQSGQVVLVGHSMGGAVITQVAELRPDAIHMLAYLAAVIPDAGETFADVPAEPRLVAAVEPDPGRLTARFNPAAAREIFYADCSEEDVAFAVSRLCAQPVGVLTTPLALTPERQGRVPRVYIQCLQDVALPLATQRALCEAKPCKRVFELDTSHSPFFSAPEALSRILIEIGAEA